MAKRYVCQANDGSTSLPTSTQSSGSQKHLLDKGTTLGLVYDYSGAVSGTVTYVVDNGPTLGLQRSSS
jgi:hypothetical protein